MAVDGILLLDVGWYERHSIREEDPDEVPIIPAPVQRMCPEILSQNGVRNER